MAQMGSVNLEYASGIITGLYSGTRPLEEQQRLQRELFALQQRVEAWGLIAPLLRHDNPNVQFYGAHTAQVKIARDWNTLPENDVEGFRDLLISLTGGAALTGRSKVVMRKLYVAIVSLALKLCMTSPPQWPDWVISSTASLSSAGLIPEQVLNYLTIVAEETSRSDLTGAGRNQLTQAIREATPAVTSAIISSLTDASRPLSEHDAALKCFEAWIAHVSSDDINALIPHLIATLSHPQLFVAAASTLTEILSSSPFSSGSGTHSLSLPLLTYVHSTGHIIFQSSLAAGEIDEVSRAFCKLLVALGEQCVEYLVKHLQEEMVLGFLRVLMGYSGFIGFGGVDEEESEITFPFWTYLSESLLDADFYADEGGAGRRIAQDLFLQLVLVLKTKSKWPSRDVLQSWSKDEITRFIAYRREVGEAIVNAYYIIRDELLRSLVNPMVALLEYNDPSRVDWEEVEASLFCIKSAQEAVPLQANTYLDEVFGPRVMDRLPNIGAAKVRQTTLGLIGEYSTWFTTQPIPLLLRAVSYIATALQPQLSLPSDGSASQQTLLAPPQSIVEAASLSLKLICDANRSLLAPHLSKFEGIYMAMGQIEDVEMRARCFESIASVIQGLRSPDEGIVPTEAILRPVVAELRQALGLGAIDQDASRLKIIDTLKLVTALARGLTPSADIFHYDSPSAPEGDDRVQLMEQARNDTRMVNLRKETLNLVGQTMGIWSSDAEIANTLSDLLKSITSLPTEATLISLPPAPLLELICMAADRNLTAVWLTLASKLIIQLESSPPFWTTSLSLRNELGEDMKVLVDQATASLCASSLRVLGGPGVMEENPDLVQGFFGCLESIAQTFVRALLVLPQDLSNALMQCTAQGICMQERYSLVACCKFLVALLRRSLMSDSWADQGRSLFQLHGQTLVHTLVIGIAFHSPRSAVPNLAEALGVFVSKLNDLTRVWLSSAMASDAIMSNPRITPADRDTFIKAVTSSRATKKTAAAANEFALVGRGLSGTSYAAGTTL